MRQKSWKPLRLSCAPPKAAANIQARGFYALRDLYTPHAPTELGNQSERPMTHREVITGVRIEAGFEEEAEAGAEAAHAG